LAACHIFRGIRRLGQPEDFELLLCRAVDTIGGGDTASFNVGGIYDFNAHFHLLFSGGRGLQNAALANRLSYYFAIQSTF
jgi:hypothetical protein